MARDCDSLHQLSHLHHTEDTLPVSSRFHETYCQTTEAGKACKDVARRPIVDLKLEPWKLRGARNFSDTLFLMVAVANS